MAVKSAGKLISAKNFVHLHNHSHYSLLDGLQKVPEMLDRVKKLGMESVALTDHGSLSGAIEFYKEAKARGIKPVIGIETYVAPRTHSDKEGKEDANPFHLILLAMNNEGYHNLLKLSSIASLEGFYYKPRIDHDLLEKYNQGLIVLSACASGEIGEALKNGQIAKAEETANWYKKVFGDRYYLEAQDHGHEWQVQAQLNEQILAIGEKLKIPVVVTADAHYAHETDQDAHEVLLCVQTGSLLNDENRMSLGDMHLFVSDPKEIASRWSEHPEVLTNTAEVAARCDVNIEFGKLLIPKFITPQKESEQAYLESLAYQGLAWRYGDISRAEAQKLSQTQIEKHVTPEQLKRLRYELNVIKKMGFAGYFLVVADFVNWAKDKGIIIGPGRGSAAASITAYALNIAELDPLEYDLLFERFLNPDRVSMPDFDIDFQDDRRDEVIRYVINKYGEDRVANIVTFGKMAARNAIRDTARVLGVAYGDADRLAKMVPPPIQGRQIPLAESIKKNPELKAEYAQNPQSKQVIDLALRLEGTIRSHGVHAAGVVIAPDTLTNYTPLEMAQKGVVATQYSMGPVEELGLLKIDFLGLSNLTVIKNALRIIRKVYKKNINIGTIPLDDPKVYELLSRGETTGVFQLESSGMKRYLKQLKPSRFSDIIAMVALYRPGPMAEIPRYIEGKSNPKEATYPHPLLEPILKDTYGVMVYQEQIIAMLQLMAGYSPGEADLVRKAIGKKKRDIMKAEEPRFIQGCQRRGLSKAEAEKLWALIQPFADYSFNKAHAACYGLIAYQTAYLKAHYPSAFMAALLTSDYENTDRIAIELAECKQMGIEVLPPDVNEGFVEFAVRPEDDSIRFSLAAIKNVGVGAVEKILEARTEGPFKSVEDFAKRVPLSDVNRKAYESLIKAGAFDSLGDRSQLLFNLDNIIGFASRTQKSQSNGQTDLFGTSTQAGIVPTLDLAPSPEELDERESLSWERELLGIYLSRHPLEEYQAYLAQEAMPIEKLSTEFEDRSVTVGGLITTVRKITTRKGSNMAFVGLEDLKGNIELIVFPKAYEALIELWRPDRVVIIKGKLSSKDRDGRAGGELKIMVDSAEALEPGILKQVRPGAASPAQEGKIVINLPDTKDAAKLSQMKELLTQHQGESEVVVIIGEDTQIRLPFTVSISQELQAQLEQLFSKEAIALA